MTPELTARPTLHEIAAMPFPASQQAMRRHYDPKWGTDLPEGKGQFRVRFDWTISGHFDDVIEANSAEDAEEIARDMARDNTYSGDFETGSVKVTEASE